MNYCVVAILDGHLWSWLSYPTEGVHHTDQGWRLYETNHPPHLFTTWQEAQRWLVGFCERYIRANDVRAKGLSWSVVAERELDMLHLGEP